MRRLCLLLLACVCLLGGCKEDKPAEPVVEGCSVHVLSIGKADAILVLADGEAMLIDAGYQENGDEIVAYLKAQGVEQLTYVVATHPDKDHIGGMSAVLSAIATKTLLVSPRKGDSQGYLAMQQSAAQAGTEWQVPEILSTYPLGKGTLTVLAPGADAMAEDTDNDASLVLRYDYGERSFLFMGDAGSATEKEMRENGTATAVDVLKIGHHGQGGTTKKFLAEIAPAYAVICCGTTDEGTTETPSEKVLERLTESGVTVFRTDTDGTVVFETDGVTLSPRKNP